MISEQKNVRDLQDGVNPLDPSGLARKIDSPDLFFVASSVFKGEGTPSVLSKPSHSTDTFPPPPYGHLPRKRVEEGVATAILPNEVGEVPEGRRGWF